MQKALAGLNSEGGPDFVSVYIDDIVIFSETLEDHLWPRLSMCLLNKFHGMKTVEALQRKLVEAPVLAYPSFTKDFVLETDASIEGLGAVLSQMQQDGYQDPITFASRAISLSERNYSITELEMLAVVWALLHFHYYLYNLCVTVYT